MNISTNGSKEIYAALMVVLMSSFVTGQTIAKKNNPYSPSPEIKATESRPLASANKARAADAALFLQNDMPAATQPTVVPVRTAASRHNTGSGAPTETYKVGIGDVLYVNLANSPNGSRYCTVRSDGMIDFPLAGENLIAAGRTVDAIAETITDGIKLFNDPKVEVSVREYSSHKITVSGMVDDPGTRVLRREAVPLFAVRSESVGSSQVTRAIVKRSSSPETEYYDLNESENVLIYPGDAVEFTNADRSAHTYYISGDVNLTGRRDLTPGLTLFEAVIASGLARSAVNKATIRRKNPSGLFSKTDHNLRSIKDGRSVDPTLEPGDIIEVRK